MLLPRVKTLRRLSEFSSGMEIIEEIFGQNKVSNQNTTTRNHEWPLLKIKTFKVVSGLKETKRRNR